MSATPNDEPDEDEQTHRVRLQIDRRMAVVFLVTLIAIPTGLTILLYTALTAWGVDGWWRTFIVLSIPAWWAYVGHWMYTVLGIPAPWGRRYRR